MMGIVRPTAPVPRRLLSLRGSVVKHLSTTTGMWIWKTIHPAIVVAFNKDQYEQAFVRDLNEVRTLTDGMKHIPAEVRIDMPREKQINLPVGSKVGVTFCISGPHFLNGHTSVATLDVVRIEVDTVLENEVLGFQEELSFS